MYRMSPSQLFIGAHFQFQFCTYSIRCVFRYFQFSLQSFDSISSDVRVHFSYFFSCAREKRDEREKTQNKNPHQRESNVRKKKTEMHEVRVMCNGHKNSIRTNTCDQRKESVVVFSSLSPFMSFVSLWLLLYFIGFGSRLALRRICFGVRKRKMFSFRKMHSLHAHSHVVSRMLGYREKKNVRKKRRNNTHTAFVCGWFPSVFVAFAPK